MMRGYFTPVRRSGVHRSTTSLRTFRWLRYKSFSSVGTYSLGVPPSVLYEAGDEIVFLIFPLQEYTPPVSTEQIISVLDDIDIKLSYDENKNMRVETNGTDVSAAIRTPEVTALVSQVAAVSEVRTKMVELQRAMAKCGKVLMDGRDIGTCVLPNADLKIFLTASVEERANRRARQMKEKGYDIDVEEIKKDIIARDEADMNREISPLKKADDALLLDTTEMTIEEVLAAIVKMAQD